MRCVPGSSVCSSPTRSSCPARSSGWRERATQKFDVLLLRRLSCRVSRSSWRRCDRVRPSRPFPVLLELGRRRRTDRRSQRRRGLGGRGGGCRIVASGIDRDGGVRRDPRPGRRSRRRRRRRRVPRRDRRTHPCDRRGAAVRAGSPEVIVTAGGSAYFDYVVDHLSRVDIDLPTRLVIRPGCYISHDDGTLHTPRRWAVLPRTGQDEHLVAAIEVWGVVLSRPEPTRVIVGIGKRDASSDGQLPVLKKIRRRGTGDIESVGRGDPRRRYQRSARLPRCRRRRIRLAVGDLVGFGISHPCTTYDKWRAIPIVDDAYRRDRDRRDLVLRASIRQ